MQLLYCQTPAAVMNDCSRALYKGNICTMAQMPFPLLLLMIKHNVTEPPGHREGTFLHIAIYGHHK